MAIAKKLNGTARAQVGITERYFRTTPPLCWTVDIALHVMLTAGWGNSFGSSKSLNPPDR
jgi:hypothetical protein